MSAPTLRFISEDVQDKRLEKTLIYQYYPSAEMKEEILKGFQDHTKVDLGEYIVDVKVEINLKKYNDLPNRKVFHYENQINDTKNT